MQKYFSVLKLDQMEPTEIYIPLTEWNLLYRWPTLNGMRKRFQFRKSNGFETAFLKDGKTVLVKPNEFFACIERKNKEKK